MKVKVNVCLIISFLLLTGLLNSCGKSQNNHADYSGYIAKIKKHRAETDEWMKSSNESPFNYKGKVKFHPLNYFDIDPGFVFKSKLVEYKNKEHLSIFGTKGEERASIRFGYLTFGKDDKNYKIDVYKNEGKNNKTYFSIWFTDKTTGKESYEVGRYLEFEYNPDTNFVYTIDFNLAFNPYCAYSHEYSCAIPSDKDYLDLAITAGEKKFHE